MSTSNGDQKDPENEKEAAEKEAAEKEDAGRALKEAEMKEAAARAMMEPPTVLVVLSPASLRGRRVLSAGYMEVLAVHHPDGPCGMFCVIEPSPGDAYSTLIRQDDCVTAEVPSCCYAPPYASLAERLYAASNLAGPIERAGRDQRGVIPSWKMLTAWAEAGHAESSDTLTKWHAVAAASGADIIATRCCKR